MEHAGEQPSRELANQIDAAEVRGWQVRLAEAEQQHQRSRRTVREIRWLVRRHQKAEIRLQSKLFALARWERFRAWAENGPLQRSGTSLFMLALATAAAIVLTGAVTLEPRVLITAGGCGLLLGMLAALAAVYYPRDSELIVWAARCRDQFRRESLCLADISEQLRQAQAESQRDFEQLSHVEETYRRYAAALRSRRQKLLATDWRSLRGADFGDFVVEVLRTAGYRIEIVAPAGEPTERPEQDAAHSGGLGLLATLGDLRLAVLALGGADEVGPAAVQRVQDLARQHDCRQACVITRGRFSPAARRAAGMSCRLIPAAQLPALVRGDWK
ncbi:MAG: restriction endonuclease [Pirellulaceae bacterium]|nr:restriction endonuclease [Pirellulaceae bacterium]